MPPVRNIALSAMLLILSNVAAMAAARQAITTAQLLDFCRSTTMAEAEGKARLLSWQKMDDAVNSGWREGFLETNGGTVEVVTWERDDVNTEGLSFWIAIGESRHRACSYSTKTPNGLLDGLKHELGTPSSTYYQDVAETAFWQQGSMQAAFSRVDSTAVVTISYKF